MCRWAAPLRSRGQRAHPQGLQLARHKDRDASSGRRSHSHLACAYQLGKVRIPGPCLGLTRSLRMFVTSHRRERGSSRHASLCAPQRREGWNHPHLQPHPPPAFQGSRCSREGSRWPRWGGAFCFRSAGRVPKAGRGMESGSCLVIEASPRLCRGDEAGARHGGRTWQQREGLRGGTWRDGNHHRGQAWPTVQVSNAMLGQGDFSSGHWGATVVRELRRCTPGPGAGL